MKLNPKKAIAAAVLGASLLAGQAQAAITPAGSDLNNLSGSELLFTVFNTANGQSYSRDLGIAFNSITATSVFSFAADAGLTGLLGSAADLIWGVHAADSNQAGTTFDSTEYGQRIQFTSVPVLPVINEDGLLGAVSKLDTYMTSLNTEATHNVPGNGTAIVSGGPGNPSSFASVASNLGSNVPFSTMSAIGSTLTYSLFGQVGSVEDFGFPFFLSTGVSGNILGNWNLDNAGLLTFNGASVSAVPVPAAVWLFGSALVGLFGVGRRKIAA